MDKLLKTEVSIQKIRFNAETQSVDIVDVMDLGSNFATVQMRELYCKVLLGELVTDFQEIYLYMGDLEQQFDAQQVNENVIDARGMPADFLGQIQLKMRMKAKAMEGLSTSVYLQTIFSKKDMMGNTVVANAALVSRNNQILAVKDVPRDAIDLRDSEMRHNFNWTVHLA